MDWIAGLIIVLVIGIFLVVLDQRRISAWSDRRSKRIKKELENVASTLNMDLRWKDHNLSFSEFPYTEDNGQIYWSLSSSFSDRKIVLFDYAWLSGSGIGTRVNYQTIAAFQLTERSLPMFRLRPSTPIRRDISEFLVFQTPSDFSNNYLLEGDDEDAIRAIFNHSMLNYLNTNLGWSLEGSGEWLLIYKEDRRFAPDELGQFLSETSRIAEF